MNDSYYQKLLRERTKALTEPKSDLLRLSSAATYLRCSLSTLWRLEQRDPSFPKKIKASSRVCYYRKSDLDAWLAGKEV